MNSAQKKWVLTGIGAVALTTASIGGIVAASLPASASDSTSVTSLTTTVGHNAVEDGTPDGETADDQGNNTPDQETADDQSEQDGETADD